jgi:hypothetical protein
VEENLPPLCDEERRQLQAEYYEAIEADRDQYRVTLEDTMTGDES